MEVASFCPLRVGSLLWVPRSGAYVLTVIAKATYALTPGVCQLAERQEEANEYDNHWNDDDSRSVYAPSDLLPFKPRADVVLVGHAFAPNQVATRSLVARLLVANIDKTVEVWCERLLLLDGTIRQGAPFIKLPLRYERAAHHPDNPVGMRSEQRPDKGRAIVLPNLQSPEHRPGGRTDSIAPIGFGPVTATWPVRASRLPRHLTELPAGWNRQPLPEGLDPGFFNVAPPDQQAEHLADDEKIVLENLHPHHARLVTALPGLAPQVIVDRDGRSEELAMNADTLWFDTDRALCTLTWRGHVRLARADAPGLVSVSMIQGVPAASPSRVEGIRATETQVADLQFGESTILPAPAGGRGTALPFAARPIADGGGIPIWQASPQPPQVPHEEGGETLFALSSALSSMPLPFVRSGASTAAPEPFAPAPGHPYPPVEPVAMAPVPPSPPVAAPIASDVPSPVAPLAPLATSVAFSDASLFPADAPPRVGSVSALKDAGILPGMPPMSAIAASNAAADPWPVMGGIAGSAPAPLRSRTPVELLWFDQAFLEAIRKDHVMKRILAEHKKLKRPRKEDKKEPLVRPAQGQADPRDREDIQAILTLGDPSSVDRVEMALEDAVDDIGVFNPPIVLLGGDIFFVFDEVETLKATIAAASPFAASDKALKETITAVSDLLRTPWLQAAGSGTERLTTQIKDALAAGHRSLPQGYLATHTERILLENRHYQKRTLLGQQWIRALFGPADGQPRMPTYIPHSLARDLPVYQRFPVRLIAEVRNQVDQYEVHPNAIRVLALGRVLGGGQRR